MQLTIGEFRQRVFTRFPIVQFVVEQSDVLVVQRPVDMRWHYHGVIPMSVAGFNPLRRRVFYGKNSYVQKILEDDKRAPCERLEWCLYELFFVLHDYMHIWAVSKLLRQFPHCASENALSNPASVADLAFILLVSEAVATVSIDWWMLSRVNMSEVLGSPIRFRCLTTSFKLTDLRRAQSIYKAFQVDCPKFFEWMTVGYLTGVFSGFDTVKRSILDRSAPWLEKEQSYGVKQRELCARWVGYLSQIPASQVRQYFELNASRRAAISLMATDLWSAFGAGSPSELSVSGQVVSLPSRMDVSEFEFVDLAHVFSEIRSINVKALTDRQFGFLAAQWLSYSPWDPRLGITPDVFDDVIRNRDVERLRSAVGDSVPASARTSNPCRHLFLPN